MKLEFSQDYRQILKHKI